MDRFIMKISMGYPDYEDELKVMENGEGSGEEISPVMTTAEVAELIGYVEKVKTTPSIKKYILDIVTATRTSDYVRLGVSPRGSIALLKATKAYAFVMGRDYCVPDDVKAVMTDVLAHRLMLSPKGKSSFETNGEALEAIAMKVNSPVTAE
jgi:MoxR-like ATPase